MEKVVKIVANECGKQEEDHGGKELEKEIGDK